MKASMIASTTFVIVLTLIIIMLWRKRKDRTPAQAYSAEGESSSSSDTFNSTPEWKYDVFLSFAGKDTRLKFRGHLNEAFKTSGIITFSDDVVLERGGDIEKGLNQGIEDSLCEVVIISENYAYSTWCLNELQKILESRKTLNRRVFPIFYDVNPADVRHQRKSFGKALAEHGKKFGKNTTKVQNWRKALFEISNFSGWDTRGKDEADLIKNIVGDVWTYLSSKLQSYDDNLVGIDSRMADMMSILEIKLDDKRFVGIWGMGGVGKTTLARVVSEKLADKFEVCCFLPNVRETLLKTKGLVSLQKNLLSHLRIKDMEISNYIEGMWKIRKLLCNKKVLLVLDDLDDVSQLKDLAESPDWFGEGSKIIITTRDHQLLTSSGVDKKRIYKMETMKEDESLRLFSNKAFNKDHPPEGDYLEYSKSVVKYAGGLPLALEVLGSFFCGRSEDEWKDALGRLKKISDDDRVLRTLRISYDGLKNEQEKTIFLDIACFFNGWKRDEVAQILKNCDLDLTIGINILIERGLLIEKKALDGETVLEVHDLLQELARSIVFQESPHHVHGRSRLCNLEDIKVVLETDEGSKAIQAIALPYNLYGEIEVHREAFSKLCNLRLLIISSELELPDDLKCFSSALKVIHWRSFPLDTLPVGNKLVEIQMPFSKIKHWNDVQLMKMLKFLDLSYSKELVETPDFSEIPNLEKLNLERCSSLVTVHHSLGELKKIVEVNLSCCSSLEILPKKLEMISLTKLDISWCFKLPMLPEFGECMKKLTVLDASNTFAITELPKSLGFLTGLRDLNLSGHQEFVLQTFGFNLTSLTMLDLSDCHLTDGSIPEDLGGLSSLIALHLERNDFANLPTGCFSNLFQLLHLYLNNCESLESLPKLPPRLIHLEALGCHSMEPLSSEGMWNMVSSLDHEYRHRTNYEKRVLQPIQSGYAPEAGFHALMPKFEIPSWFPNRRYVCSNQSGTDDDEYESSALEYELDVDGPPCFCESEWCAAVCLVIKGVSYFEKILISWSCKAPGDHHYVCEEWANEISLKFAYEPRLCLMLLDFNEKTCWQHLRGNNNRLHVKLSITCLNSQPLSMDFGWRALCKEEWGNTNTSKHNHRW